MALPSRHTPHRGVVVSMCAAGACVRASQTAIRDSLATVTRARFSREKSAQMREALLRVGAGDGRGAVAHAETDLQNLGCGSVKRYI